MTNNTKIVVEETKGEKLARLSREAIDLDLLRQKFEDVYKEVDFKAVYDQQQKR